MKTLWVIRHAKSSWEEPLLSDHARPLNERGKRDAVALGTFLAEQASLPEVWLISDSKRTRKTFKRIQNSFPLALHVEVEGHLYHASVSHLIRRIGALSDQLSHVALVGHNPGLADLCAHLGCPVAELPTSGFVCFGMSHWEKAALGDATCMGGWFPKTGKWGYSTE